MPLFIGAAVVGGLGSAYGAYKSAQSAKGMKQYDMNAIRDEMAPWQASIDKTNAMSDQMRGRGEGMYGQADQFFDPSSAYYDQQRQIMNEQVAGQTANVSQQQNQLMSQRGMGGGGISSLLGAVNANQAGEQVKTGMLGMQQQGIGLGQKQQQLAGGVMGDSASLLSEAMGQQGNISENMAQAYIGNVEQFNAMKAQEANAWSSFGSSMGQMGSAGVGGYTKPT